MISALNAACGTAPHCLIQPQNFRRNLLDVRARNNSMQEFTGLLQRYLYGINVGLTRTITHLVSPIIIQSMIVQPQRLTIERQRVSQSHANELSLSPSAAERTQAYRWPERRQLSLEILQNLEP
jgi:hypothetical protein